LQLSIGQRAKLLRQDFYAAFGIGGNVKVRLEEGADGLFVLVEGERIAVPSPLRWKLYRKGWRARLERLVQEYGVGRHALLDAQSVVIDVGANVGEFAHVCARAGARAYCFEPDPAAFACLSRNAAGLPNIKIADAVIWKSDGTIDFAQAPARADSSVFADGPRITRRALAIESLVKAERLSRIDLIKCDAEGAEPEVLEGIGEAFPIVRAVALDTGAERMGRRTNDECAAILKAHGFHVMDERIGTRLMTYGVRGDRQVQR
jgi:FkbM family methyltransferase